MPWLLALFVVLSRGVWDAGSEAVRAFRPARRDEGPGRKSPHAGEASGRAAVPALRITAGEGWKRNRQRLTREDGDPRRVVVDVFDTATNERGLTRALMRSVDGEDAAPPRSTSFPHGPGTAVRTVRAVESAHGPRITATWHWDDGRRAVLMCAFDLEPERFAAVEADLDAVAAGIRIGTI